MARMKEKLQSLARVGVIAAGIVGGLEVTDTEESDAHADAPREAITQTVVDVRRQIDENVSFDDREKLLNLISMAEEIPSGRQIVQALAENGTRLTIDDAEKMGLSAGITEPDLSEIRLNRAIFDEPLEAIATFVHEGEHVRTIDNDHKNNISLESFASMDDEHTWEMAREALAVRKQYMAVCELIAIHPELDPNREIAQMLESKFDGDISKMAQTMFDRRMSGEMLNNVILSLYEHSVVFGGIKERENVTNPVKLAQNPDWNHLIDMASGGEVKNLNVMPIPSMDMVRWMVQQGVFRQVRLSMHSSNGENPDNSSLQSADIGQMDLTSIMQHKDRILEQGDFCPTVCNLVAERAFWILKNLQDPTKMAPWLEELKTIMPQAQIDSLMREQDDRLVLPHDFYDENLQAFLAEQNNFDYLKKAQNVLASPKLREGYENNLLPPIQHDTYKIDRDPTELIHQDKEILSVFNKIFFAKENKVMAHQRGRALQNIHL